MEYYCTESGIRIQLPKCENTTFIHTNIQRCKTWSIQKNKNTKCDKPEQSFFNRETLSQQKVSGPASDQNTHAL